jgi:ADP-ribosyl-[dinitrogen reductase] hydrolase
VRTSLSHPLQIASVSAGMGYGRIGITFCPGKKQESALTGSWDRDLAVDLDAITQWGASAVVTFLEAHEISDLKVEALGAAVAARHMNWFHLPIPDVSTPGSSFEQAWEYIGRALRARLRDGFDILVHCKGGLGRAGMIAARLLAELGMAPKSAIEQVRAVRPGAIETSAQEAYVLAIDKVTESLPAVDAASIRDRAVGALLGLAVGDAVGTTLEFSARDSRPTLTDMVGGGPFGLEPGQWTDDTSMALALAASLEAYPTLREVDLMRRFTRWYENGDYSSTGHCFDIGTTTRQALRRWSASGDPISGSSDPHSAGNGSLMRLAPVAIRHWQDREKLSEVAARQSATTHAAPEAVDACRLFADVLADAIEGKPRNEVLRQRYGVWAGKIGDVAAGSWRGKRRDQISSSGYVVHCLEAALWSVGRTSDFRSAILIAANLGDDADTTAAVTGQLAGALYGASPIPSEWLQNLAWAPRIRAMAEALLA